jgi:hypothetical protein
VTKKKQSKNIHIYQEYLQMDPPPQRTQYIFDSKGIRGKSRSDILTMQRQWDTFERIENYNDVVYQRLQQGLRDRMYYQFRDRSELNDYRIGQELHVRRYPDLPVGTFASISDRPMPTVEVLTKAPNYSMGVEKGLLFSTSISASERMEVMSDLAIYSQVSTFNATHVFKYNFPSDEEKMAYLRAERRIILT